MGTQRRFQLATMILTNLNTSVIWTRVSLVLTEAMNVKKIIF